MTFGIYACIRCGEQIQPTAKGVLSEVKGWVEARTDGGVHHLIQRVATGRYIHRACLEPETHQDGLFG